MELVKVGAAAGLVRLHVGRRGVFIFFHFHQHQAETFSGLMRCFISQVLPTIIYKLY
jgi:hypothetical protein